MLRCAATPVPGSRAAGGSNITSVDIGCKVTGGERGRQVVLRFTVTSKAAEPEVLGTAQIPEIVTPTALRCLPTSGVAFACTPRLNGARFHLIRGI